MELSTDVDSDLLFEALDQHHVDYFKTKSDVAAVIIALGGGVGIAAIIKSAASGIRQYFESASKLELARKRSLTVTIADDKIQFTAENAGTAESELLKRIMPRS
jgi:hypothetical protein